jgi:hypothetical protein
MRGCGDGHIVTVTIGAETTDTAYEDELSVVLAAAAVPIVVARLYCTLAVVMSSPCAWISHVIVTPLGGGGGGLGGAGGVASPEVEAQLHPAVHMPVHVACVPVQSHWWFPIAL